MKSIAILGPTASGKTDLSIALASEYNAVILSLDSLSVYKYIDIASAKPTPKERGEIKHFGIDVIDVDSPFNVSLYSDLYMEAKRYALEHDRPLIIVGGTGFYLKMLIEGLSSLPPLSKELEGRIRDEMSDLQRAYSVLLSIDQKYAESISASDRYRIEKGLQIYFRTGKPPSEHFKNHPPRPLIDSVSLYEIEVDRTLLHKRIETRTQKMFDMGLLDEVADLEYRYGRAPNPMKAIGIKEVLDYFDGKRDIEKTKENIIIHTRQLAKRQRTFNKTQLPPHPVLPPDEIFKEVSSLLDR